MVRKGKAATTQGSFSKVSRYSNSKKASLSSRPSILLIDIETAPDLVWSWGVYEQNAIDVKEHWYILTFAHKWYGKPAKVVGLDDYSDDLRLRRNAERWLLMQLWQLLDQADIVVAHNGADFDIKKINARFISFGLTPPSPYTVVDTKRELKRAAAFSSNKLDWIGAELGLGRKLEHEGFPMWRGCMMGDAKAFRKMKRYNKHDVVLLERLYTRLLPWMRQPNGSLWQGGLRCVNPTCGSTKLQQRGSQRTKSRLYARYQCQVCGTWARAPKAEAIKAAVVPI